MSKESFDMVVAEAERMWRAQYPNRRENTRTAQMQIGLLLKQARFALLDRGVVLA